MTEPETLQAVEWNLTFDFPPNSPYDQLQGQARLDARNALFTAVRSLATAPGGALELDTQQIEEGYLGVPYIQEQIQLKLDLVGTEDPPNSDLTVGTPVVGCVYYEWINGRPKCIQCFHLLKNGVDLTHSVSTSAGLVVATYHVGVSWQVMVPTN